MSAARGKRQFRALVRLFAYRFFDTDILSIRGDISSLLGQFAALLMALSFILVLLIGPRYGEGYARWGVERVHTAAWADQEFLISTTMAVIGVFTLLLWDALFPDRRDSLLLDCCSRDAMPITVNSRPSIFRSEYAPTVSRPFPGQADGNRRDDEM